MSRLHALALTLALALAPSPAFHVVAARVVSPPAFTRALSTLQVPLGCWLALRLMPPALLQQLRARASGASKKDFQVGVHGDEAGGACVRVLECTVCDASCVCWLQLAVVMCVFECG